MSRDDHENPFPLTGRFLAGRLRDELSHEEKLVFEEMIDEVVTFKTDHRLISAGDMPGQSTLLIEGFMLRTIEDAKGRHAVSCHVAGDFVDLHCFALKKLDHNIDCVGPVKVGLVPHARLNEVMETRPHLARIFWYSTLLDAAMHREWIKKLEHLLAPQRIAHIVCEIWHRLDMVGLASKDGFETPLRQADLAEMIGATPVHTNRALNQLRENDMLTFAHGQVEFADRAALEKYASFDVGYLYKNSQISFLRDGKSGG